MANSWLVVELQRPDELLALFTARYPGSTLDVIAQAPIQTEHDVVHPCVLLVRNAPPAAIDGLIDALAGVYGNAHTIRRSDAERVWLARLTVPESGFHDAGLEALARFQGGWGLPWVHLEQGVFHMRAKVQEGVDPERLLAQVQGYLEAQGIDADLSLQEGSSQNVGLWNELVEHAGDILV